MSEYHKAYKNAEKRRTRKAQQLPEGLRLRRRKESSLDTRNFRILKGAFMLLLAVGSAMAVILFVRSFVSGDMDVQPAPAPKQKNAYQTVDVQIHFKPEKENKAE